MSRKRFILLTTIVLLLAAGWKLVFLIWGKVPFNSDEAIIGLMARHILDGETPIFFYGQSYMGSLDAWLVAAGFAIFGQHIWVIRLIQIILYLGVAASSIWIVFLISDNRKAAIISGVLLVFPTINVFLYTTASLGGYNEALLIGNILILLVIKTQQMDERTAGKKKAWGWFSFLWGFFAGLGIWANALTIVYIVPCLIYRVWNSFIKDKNSRNKLTQFLLTALIGSIFGAIPILIYILQNGWSEVIGELLGSAVSVESQGFAQRIGLHIRNLVFLGFPVIFGIRPPWEIKWLVLPLLPFVLFAWFTFIWTFVRIKKNGLRFSGEMWLLTGVIILLVIGFLLTSFGADPSGRYFLPLYTISVICIGVIYQKPYKTIYTACLCVLILYNAASTFQCGIKDPPAITTQFYAPSRIDHTYDPELIKFLKQEGEYFGYTNYWVSYPLAFQSDEQIIFVPRLPYHEDLSYTERDDRYKPYQEIVDQAEHPAYIATRQTELDEYLRNSFGSLGITWKEKIIGDYIVFFELSKTVRPRDIGLGFSSQ